MNGSNIIVIIVLSVVAIMTIAQITFIIKTGFIYVKANKENESLKKEIKELNRLK